MADGGAGRVPIEYPPLKLFQTYATPENKADIIARTTDALNGRDIKIEEVPLDRRQQEAASAAEGGETPSSHMLVLTSPLLGIRENRPLLREIIEISEPMGWVLTEADEAVWKKNRITISNTVRARYISTTAPVNAGGDDRNGPHANYVTGYGNVLEGKPIGGSTRESAAFEDAYRSRLREEMDKLPQQKWYNLTYGKKVEAAKRSALQAAVHNVSLGEGIQPRKRLPGEPDPVADERELMLIQAVSVAKYALKGAGPIPDKEAYDRAVAAAEAHLTRRGIGSGNIGVWRKDIRSALLEPMRAATKRQATKIIREAQLASVPNKNINKENIKFRISAYAHDVGLEQENIDAIMRDVLRGGARRHRTRRHRTRRHRTRRHR